MHNDVCIKAGTYCPICKGRACSDCWHNSREFNVGSSALEAENTKLLNDWGLYANALIDAEAQLAEAREALEIDPYSERWDGIVEEGYREQRRAKRGYRGQLITPMDSPEFWVCKAFADNVLRALTNASACKASTCKEGSGDEQV